LILQILIINQLLDRPLLNKLHIVIPVWRSSESLLRLLEELEGHFSITVVENQSEVPLTLPQRYVHSIQHIKVAFNSGFAHAANVGWSSQLAEFYVFLNPDTQITAKEVTQILETGKTHRLEAFSPLLLNLSGEIAWNYHQPLPSVLSLLQQFSPLSRLFPPSVPQIFDTVLSGRTLPGACLFISRQTLVKCGVWDERFWLWWEDADLSLRLHKQGFSLGTLTKLMVKHGGGESFNQREGSWKNQVFFYSLRVFVQKHFPRYQAIFEPLWSRRKITRLLPQDSDIRASIIVPNLKTELLKNFLKQLSPEWEWHKDELIVVSSSKDSQDLMLQYPNASFIWLNEPLGFAKTVNLGWQRARGQWIGTVNDDTILPKRCMAAMTVNVPAKTGSIQPCVIRPNGAIESLGVTVYSKGKASGNIKSSQPSDTVNAAAVLFAREALEQTGFFDESFVSYLEDVDLGLRIKMLGWKHCVQSQVLVTHLGHQTMSAFPARKAWYDVRNWWKIVTKPYWLRYWKKDAFGILLERGRNMNGFFKALRK